MTTVRTILNLMTSGVTNVVIYKDGYDGMPMTPNQVFRTCKSILDMTVVSIEVAEENTIRIII